MGNRPKRQVRRMTVGEYATVVFGLAFVVSSFIAAWQKSRYGQPSLIILAFVMAFGCSMFVSFIVSRPATPSKHRKKD